MLQRADYKCRRVFKTIEVRVFCLEALSVKNSPGLTGAPGSQLKHRSVKVTGPESHALNPFGETGMNKIMCSFVWCKDWPSSLAAKKNT